ncbi:MULTISPECIES: precorrin-8X methylmutase [unclassified Candidatus Frackibacter]|uniref:precorrin-8X methylmutase n=1 Tax=unclassified Candidatus Frackibacter TaxID=2648818 RepID=UPI000798145E|nr:MULTISPECIES: precorrin-8X methylmutase [unclassified Candidatus Frackibacter]KXS43891.1 MAG: precorrin-8X methylmutase [Candidatus Frackibacter sp. T328-2]SDC34004.1 precorrin-8X methylmutase [Candidatus Frackibacter sp. WG11]SEM57197.1 precorrin-8X methylmutase [Candidatus Frackibacter sp. WG12]SFL70075.1 precorrin-8X methylmutase [Candidatus Frackibacter sp. WG13]
MEIIKQPQAIEDKSMRIIEEEVSELDCTEQEKKIVKRVIHATADFDFKDLVIISDDAVEAGLKALKAGSNIVTDVNMLRAGINKRKLGALGGEVECFISDEEVAAKAKELDITRSMMAMRTAIKNPKNKVFAIGNAPTALFELMELIENGKVEPELIIGTPVGFVGAKESKAELEKMDIPFITVRGRKGGSSVAASITNALLYMT